MAHTRGSSDLTSRRMLERLSDLELAERLRGEDCDGPLWLLVREDLARAGLGTVHSCVLRGRLSARTKALGRPVTLDPDEERLLRVDRHERSTLAADAVVHGLRVFREHGILRDTWEPHRSSLRTFAVNACLREVSRSVRDWRRSRRPREYPVPDIEEITPETDVDSEPVDVEETLALLPDELRRAALIRLRTGRSWASIAPEIGTTVRTLEHQLRRFRQEHGRRNGGERS